MLLIGMRRLYAFISKTSSKLQELSELLQSMVKRGRVELSGECLNIVYTILFKIWMKTANSQEISTDITPASPVDHFLGVLLDQSRLTWTEEDYSALRSLHDGGVSRHSLGTLSMEAQKKDGKMFESLFFKMEDESAKVFESTPSKSINECIEENATNHMRYLVDQTELYLERLNTLKINYKKSEKEFDEKVKGRLALSTVPAVSGSESGSNEAVIKVQLKNEKGELNGTFGWCIVCRQSADYFCKQTKLPICSLKCKNGNLELLGRWGLMEGSIEKMDQSILGPNRFVASRRSELVELTDYIFNLARKESDSTLKNDQVLAGILENLQKILDSSGELAQDHGFISVLKRHVTDTLFNVVISTQARTLKASNAIVAILFRKYRSHLKRELYCLLDLVILKVLESQTASFTQKIAVIQLLTILFADKDILRDCYVNYECDPSYNNTLERMFTLLCSSLLTLSRDLKDLLCPREERHSQPIRI
jgi:hypothetical protein